MALPRLRRPLRYRGRGEVGAGVAAHYSVFDGDPGRRDFGQVAFKHL